MKRTIPSTVKVLLCMSLPASHPWIHGQKYKTQEYKSKHRWHQKFKSQKHQCTAVRHEIPTLPGADNILTLDTESILRSSRSCICSNQSGYTPRNHQGSHNEGQTVCHKARGNVFITHLEHHLGTNSASLEELKEGLVGGQGYRGGNGKYM